MELLGKIRGWLAELTGEAEYPRYCAHLRAHHPERAIPTQREFFLARLEEKYSRPSRCC
jgi:uncharacterized short protein YbdD (DUF466 family)